MLQPDVASSFPLRTHAPEDLRLGGSRRSRPTLEKAAQEFEAYVLKLLLAEMRKTVGSGGLFSGVSKTYQSVLEDALALKAAEAGTFGLARQLLESWGVKP